LKQTLKIGAMLLVVAALATTGIAVAQSGSEATTDEASTTEVTPLRTKIVEWLAPLVDEGTIDQSQAEAVADTLAASMPDFPGGRMDRALEAVRETADFLGLTPEEVVVAVRDGQTLAEIAVAQGQTAEALIAHLSTLAAEHLNQLVADGRITEEQQADMVANMTDRITDLVNGRIDRPMMGGPGMGRPRGMGGDGSCMGGGTDLDELGA
jgi:phenylpyruvate tautomerase PptA (4-oxalocrotonate tautomerase family)